MPVDAVRSGVGGATAVAAQASDKAPSVDNYSIGADAREKAKAETLTTNKRLTDKEKEALFLKKTNEGQHTDKTQIRKEDPTRLDEDDFMRLLLATLKCQNPTQPMDITQLLEQTSIMTNMEQVIQMTEALKQAYEAQQRVQGASMVGRTAACDLIDDEGNARTTASKVNAVEPLAEGKALVHIGDKKVRTEDILGIAGPTRGETDLVKTIVKTLQEQSQDKETRRAGKTGKTGEVGKAGETGETSGAGKTGKPEESGKTGETDRPGETGKSAATGTPGSPTGTVRIPGIVGSARGSEAHEVPAVTAGTTLGSTSAATAAANAAVGTNNRRPSTIGVDVSNTQA